MKKISKMLSAALSLTLCAALVMPSFAAVALSTALDEQGNWIADKQAEAKNKDTGVEEYYLENDLTLKKTLVIGAGVAASIELNGHALKLNDSVEKVVENNIVTGVKVTNNDPDVAGVKDANGNEGVKTGAVIKVKGDASLTITDESAVKKDENGDAILNEEGEKQYVLGQGTGAISGGNNAPDSMWDSEFYGGGISVSNTANLTMKGGKVTGNVAARAGGGIGMTSNSLYPLPNETASGTMNLEGVEVSDNVVYFATGKLGSGGGIYAGAVKDVNLTDVRISGNESNDTGGGLSAQECTNVTLTNCEVTGNRSSTALGYPYGWQGGGIFLEDCTNATLDNTKVTGNQAMLDGGGMYVRAMDTSSTVTLKNNTVFADNTAKFNKVSSERNDIHMRVMSAGKEIALNVVPNMDADGNKIPAMLQGEDGTLRQFNSWEAKASSRIYDYVNQKWLSNSYLEQRSEHLEEALSSEGKLTAEFAYKNYWNEDNTICTQIGMYDIKLTSDWVDHEHSYEEEITTTPTCTEKGEKTFTCACGDHYTVPIDPLGHDMGEWVVTKQPGPGVKGEEQRECEREGCDYKETRELPALPSNRNPGGTTIEEPEVPLAGLFTRADAIGYLWEQSGEPEWELSDFPDVPEDHEWAVAIGWAQDMGIALADKDGNFRPDDLVLRSVESLEISPEGELQEFLNRYAVYAGIELDADELFIKLEGAWDDIIMGEDAQVIFDDFFAKLEAALNAAA